MADKNDLLEWLDLRTESLAKVANGKRKRAVEVGIAMNQGKWEPEMGKPSVIRSQARFYDGMVQALMEVHNAAKSGEAPQWPHDGGLK